MPQYSSAKGNIAKIILYILFIVVTFIITLLFMPYEFFFFVGIVILFALKEIEKEVMHFRKPY